MKNIDRFEITQIRRVGRNSKIIYQCVKYGAKGVAKVNPTLVFIDAVISLGELFISYSAYRQIKEQNNQLAIQINTIKHSIDKFKKGLGLREDVYRKQLAKEDKLLDERIKSDQVKVRALKLAYNDSQKYFLLMKSEVEHYRKELPYAKETQEIVKRYHEVVTLYIDASLEYIGG